MAQSGSSPDNLLLKSCSRIAQWMFFCKADGSDPTSTFMKPDGDVKDVPSDRWRLLCWFLAASTLWDRIDMTLNHVVIIFVAAAIIGFSVNFFFNGLLLNWDTFKGLTLFMVTVGVLAGLAALGTLTAYLKLERVAKKFILNEAGLFRFWCSHTYIAVAGISVSLMAMRWHRKKE